jgi:hypothetical protein
MSRSASAAPRFPGDGREAREHRSLLADLREDLGLGVAGDVVRNREGPVGTPALRVHAPLRDHLPVEMRHLLDQPNVLQKRRTARTGGQDVRVAATGDPVAYVNLFAMDMMDSSAVWVDCANFKPAVRPTTGTASML